MTTPTDIEVFLRNRLKVLRKESGLTQAEIAELSGISYVYYQNIEHGVRPNVSIRMIDKLAQAYGLSAHELFSPQMPKIKLKGKPVPPPHYKKRKN